MGSDYFTQLSGTDFQEINATLYEELGLRFTEKHWAIIEAAIRVFSEKGFSAGTTSEIAREAGVSEGTIFNYFKTKHDLLQGLMMPLSVFVVRPLIIKGVEDYLNARPETSVDDGLMKLLMDRIHLVDEHEDLIKTVIAESTYHPDLIKPIRAKVGPSIRAASKKVFQSEIDSGVFREDLDVTIMMRMFFIIIVAHLFVKDLIPEQSNSEEQGVEGIVRQMVDIFLHGVLKDGATASHCK